MTTQTPQQTSWRDHDDRDAHQHRIATELAALLAAEPADSADTDW